MKLILKVGFFFVLAGCAISAIDRDPDNPSYGKALYDKNCAACHGPSGRGDGPAAKDLPITPANLRLLAANNEGTFDKDMVMSVIFASPSLEDAVMPAFSHSDLGPIILVEEDGIGTPVPTDLLAIATYLETIQD